MTGRALRPAQPSREGALRLGNRVSRILVAIWSPIWAVLRAIGRLARAVALFVARLTWPILRPIGHATAAPFVAGWQKWLVVGAKDPIPWRYALRRTYHGFLRHRTVDAGAALAFFSTLAIFPGALSVVSAVALGQSDGDAVDAILNIARLGIGQSAADALRPPLISLLSLSVPGVSLGVGLFLTLWSLSGYASAFGRALNMIYGVQEGRRFAKFRLEMLLLSAVMMVLFAAIAAILLITPSIAEAIGAQFRFGGLLVLLWNILKWPVLVGIVVLTIALLYYFSPNVKHPRVRWVSYGALFAIGGWALATVGFAIYITTFSNYDRVYGFLGGAVVVLVYAFISNFVLVLGGELDSQIIRVRYLQSGVEAEGLIPLPLRDSKRNLALARHQSLDLVDGRTMRLKAVRLYGEPTLDEHGQPHIRPRFQTMSGSARPGLSDEDDRAGQ
ncbi:YihY/virulence factor BrkB family protein [Frondihabitans sp. VKM Ac-2883]|uniref:YihY/virulence factor BrkB family protein n=1 Tax=Frondihabitans sp. VKM Ac-2883 TaxID=2783823 RepID=UPI00188C58D3|nr:YihY/virulence factor BrkB family protein [Frondihabitans sp. VKM Ac-2883]MBF4576798.1 YihY/virulence factor BrkB family protein [Frondihabitans sp. VKM Ac-2883]